MNNSNYMTLGEAAKATGKSKTTIGKYIKNGKLSVISKSENSYQIDPSELFRVFTPIDSQPYCKGGQSQTPKMNPDNPLKNSDLENEIEILKIKLEAEIKRADILEIEKNDWKKQAQTLLLNSPQKPVERDKKFLGIFPYKKR